MALFFAKCFFIFSDEFTDGFADLLDVNGGIEAGQLAVSGLVKEVVVERAVDVDEAFQNGRAQIFVGSDDDELGVCG